LSFSRLSWSCSFLSPCPCTDMRGMHCWARFEVLFSGSRLPPDPAAARLDCIWAVCLLAAPSRLVGRSCKCTQGAVLPAVVGFVGCASPRLAHSQTVLRRRAVCCTNSWLGDRQHLENLGKLKIVRFRPSLQLRNEKGNLGATHGTYARLLSATHCKVRLISTLKLLCMPPPRAAATVLASCQADSTRWSRNGPTECRKQLGLLACRVVLLPHCRTAAQVARAHASDTPAQTLVTVNCLLPAVPVFQMRFPTTIMVLLLLLASLSATQATSFPRRWLAVTQQGRNATAPDSALPGASYADYSQSGAAGCLLCWWLSPVRLCCGKKLGSQSLLSRLEHQGQ
jgi:hypothetical protein